MLNKLICTLAIISISTSAFSSSRVDIAINDSASEQLTKIVEMRKSLAEGKKELIKLEQQLVKANKESDSHKSYLKIRNRAAIVAVASAAALAGTYILQEKRLAAFKKSGAVFSHPSENELALGIMGILGLSGSALTAGGAEIGVLLTKDEAREVEQNVKALKDSLNKKNQELIKETTNLCREDQRHEACYLLQNI